MAASPACVKSWEFLHLGRPAFRSNRGGMPDPMPGVDDAVLVDAYRAGNSGAFEVIVRRHYAGLLERADRRCGRGALAEDAVQTALVRAHRYLKTAAAVENLGAWLRRIVDNCASDLLRRERREITVSEPITEVVLDDPGRPLERRELEGLVRGAIERVPKTYREVLFLRFLMGLEAKEIAERLDENIHSVKSRIARGRRELRRRLEGVLTRGGYL